MTTTLNASTAGAGGFIATSDNSGILALQSAGTTAVTIDTSQNVGIGTTSPAVKLHVAKTTGSSYVSYLSSGVNVSGSDNGLFIGGYDENSGSKLLNIQTNTITPDGAGYKSRFVVQGDGSVLIGTTSNGNYGEKFNISTGSSSQAIMNLVATGTGAFGAIKFRNGSGEIGSISYGASNVTYNTSSDYRLKHDIQPMTGALEKLLLLKPCTYKWNINDAQGQGFIAHELAEVVPDCVSGEKDAVDANGDIQPQGIDTSYLVATLTAAIQELSAKNDALTARIVALEQA